MNLSPALEKEYTVDRMSARKAQRLAEYIAFGPVIFEASRLMVKYGILDMLRDSADGLTIDMEVSKKSRKPYSDFRDKLFTYKTFERKSLSRSF